MTRANPNFCAFCGVRHASISCPAVNPVSDDLPSSTYAHPPSKCPDCIQSDRTKTVTVVDGVQHTITSSKLKLCAAHLVPDSSLPPVPDSSLPPVPDFNLSMSSQQVLETLQQSDDPFDLLSTQPLEDPSAVDQASADIPPPSLPTPAGPTRRRHRTKQGGRDGMEQMIHETYPLVLNMVNSGSSLNKAVQESGMPRASFFKWRYMAEMKLVNSDHYLYLKSQFRTTESLFRNCKDALTEADGTYFMIAQEMRVNKELLALA